jgi:hypothetical protein
MIAMDQTSYSVPLHTAIPRIAVALLLFFALGSAPSFAKGDGIKIGKQGSFHPRLFLNFGYDSNVLHRSHQSEANSPFAEIIGAPFLSVRPGLELKLGSKSWDFYVGGFANYSHYFQINGSTPIQNINAITAKADVMIQFLKDKPVSVTLANNFGRSTGDSFTAADVFARGIFRNQVGSQNAAAFLALTNSSMLLLSFKPGGGALSIDLGYTFSFGLYPSSDLDYNNHKIAAGVKWSFFPRTAFTFDAEFNIRNFNPRLNFGQGSPVNNNAMPFKAYVGIVGQLTEKLLLTVRVGGGSTLVQSNAVASLTDNWSMVVGNIDLTYKISLTTFFKIGARHDFSPSFFSNFFHETIGYLEFGSQFGSLVRPLVFNIRASGGYIGYGGIPSTLGGGQFNSSSVDENGNLVRGDLTVRANASLDWHVFKVWKIGLLAQFDFLNSNMFVVQGGTQTGMGYTKFEVMLTTELAF